LYTQCLPSPNLSDTLHIILLCFLYFSSLLLCFSSLLFHLCIFRCFCFPFASLMLCFCFVFTSLLQSFCFDFLLLCFFFYFFLILPRFCLACASLLPHFCLAFSSLFPCFFLTFSSNLPCFCFAQCPSFLDYHTCIVYPPILSFIYDTDEIISMCVFRILHTNILGTHFDSAHFFPASAQLLPSFCNFCPAVVPLWLYFTFQQMHWMVISPKRIQIAF